MNQHGVPPRNIAIEITETSLMKNESLVVEKLERLRALGFKIFVDDFGKGYSSLAFLKSFPLDGLKVDKLFVSEIDTNQDDLSIVSALVTLAHARHLHVVAEGVERQSQVDVLRRCDCDQYQGFFHSRAVSPPDFVDNLLSTR